MRPRKNSSVRSAEQVFPLVPYSDEKNVVALRNHWAAAVSYLRTKSSRGWILDKTVEKRNEPR